jgi:riboflavin biosynthesis pyrimidine reductase
LSGESAGGVNGEAAITRLADQSPLDDDALAALYDIDGTARRWLRVNFVSSVDGAVEVDGVSGALSTPEDQRVLRLLRMQCDALLIGAGTLRAERYGPMVLDERERAWRRERGMSEHPVLVVVSGSLNLDPLQPSFAEAPIRPLVLTQETAPAQRRDALATTTEVLTAGAGTVDLPVALEQLHGRGLRRILCEGGPHLLGGLTTADLVDEFCLTLSPLLAGAGAGRITAGPTSPLRRMALRHVLAAGDALLLRYYRSA